MRILDRKAARSFSSIVLFLAVLWFCSCDISRPEIRISDTPSAETLNPADGFQDQTDPGNVGTGQLAEGLFIEELFSYSGPFVEDGSNDPCENIAAVRIVNGSALSYRYLKFSLETADAVYSFAASTVMAGTEMTVLNEKKEPYTGDRIIACETVTIAPFTEPPSVYPDKFSISYLDFFLNVRNLTEKPIGNVSVYYKNTDENGFFGGITYRSFFGVVEGGQTLQNRVENLRKDSSVIVFVTYGP